MKFGEKIKALRAEKNMSQAELAKAIGITTRAVQNYELVDAHPRKRELYQKIADVFGVNVNYLLTEDEKFISDAQEHYGRRGALDAKELISQVSALFAGGEVTEDTKDEVMRALQEAYWIAKKNNKKYTPKKYRKAKEKDEEN